MADDPSWEGIARGVLVLGLMWWAWTGYAWLTSVVEPEEGGVRLVIFAAMAGLLVVSLCVPGAFGDEATLFACAYAVVRFSQIGLFLIANCASGSKKDPSRRRPVPTAVPPASPKTECRSCGSSRLAIRNRPI
jgi:low temperature requirement protein LtrA